MRSLLQMLVCWTMCGPVSLVAQSHREISPHALPETCYLFSYFYHARHDESFRLAWSRDGRQFDVLSEGQSYLKPAVGDGEKKLMRDPCLFRAPDGVFHLVWTTGWTGRTIGHATSCDLLHWSDQQAIPVMQYEPNAQNCWAPELIWDDAKQRYLIFWSSTILGRYPETERSNGDERRNHRIYSTTTTDFKSFTPTRLLYDGGFNVIDATMLKDDNGAWLLFVKNETRLPNTEKNIRMVRGPTPEGPWGDPSPPITGNYWAEGPSALKVGPEYRVYFDKHRVGAIGLVVSRDLQSWTDVSDRVTFPKDARHGTVLAVPREIVVRLLTASAQLPAP